VDLTMLLSSALVKFIARNVNGFENKKNFSLCCCADNVGGVFVVLGFGCLFALIVAVLEFLWNVKKVAVEQKVSII
jgi:hypothetical protein